MPVRAFEDSIAAPGGGKVRRWEERNQHWESGRPWRVQGLGGCGGGQGGQRIVMSAVGKMVPRQLLPDSRSHQSSPHYPVGVISNSIGKLHLQNVESTQHI